MEMPDVVGTATGLTDNNSLTILVFTKQEMKAGEIPEYLEGIPVTIQVTGEIFALREQINGVGGNVKPTSKFLCLYRSAFDRQPVVFRRNYRCARGASRICTHKAITCLYARKWRFHRAHSADYTIPAAAGQSNASALFTLLNALILPEDNAVDAGQLFNGSTE
jgi:hypothetical protein